VIFELMTICHPNQPVERVSDLPIHAACEKLLGGQEAAGTLTIVDAARRFALYE
jgi:hypothetical protein